MYHRYPLNLPVSFRRIFIINFTEMYPNKICMQSTNEFVEPINVVIVVLLLVLVLLLFHLSIRYNVSLILERGVEVGEERERLVYSNNN